MTFTEAALEVLRGAGEPLHYKRITELAIERNLLSHVGKTPEVTMSSRLAMLVKKDRGQSPIIKVKPGVFAIRESALQDFAAAVAAAAALEAESSSEDGSVVAAPAEASKPPVLPGGDVFPEEEGDDDPILAGLEQEGDAGKEGGRRRRRRRRRGKGGEKDLPLDAAPGADAPVREPARDREPNRDRNQGGRDRDREPNRDRNQGGRDRDREPNRDRNQGGRDREPNRDRPRVDEMAALDWNRQPGDGDLLGKDLADAVWAVLSSGERIAHPFSRVAELLVRRGRLSGTPAALAPTIAAAARADIARAEQAHACPRFRIQSGRLLLSEWQLSKPLARAEQELLNAAERYGVELRRTLINKLCDLPAAGFAELVATWLNAEGVTALRAVRRPGSSITEFHFAGTRKRGSEETRLAIVVLRGSRELPRESVVEVRGALHHYGQATTAWIVSTGRITTGAREEAAMEGAAPCALFDGMELATAMEKLGIAVRSHVIAHHELDFDLLESLGDTQEQRDRRDREERDRNDGQGQQGGPSQGQGGQGRGRDRDRERGRGGRRNEEGAGQQGEGRGQAAGGEQAARSDADSEQNGQAAAADGGEQDAEHDVDVDWEEGAHEAEAAEHANDETKDERDVGGDHDHEGDDDADGDDDDESEDADEESSGSEDASESESESDDGEDNDDDEGDDDDDESDDEPADKN